MRQRAGRSRQNEERASWRDRSRTRHRGFERLRSEQPFGAVAVVGLLGGPPVLESFNLMQDLPSATRLSFFPSGLLGTAALPLTDAPLRAIAEGISAGRIPSLRARTFDFGDVRQAHALMESDRALGKLVVRLGRPNGLRTARFDEWRARGVT